MTLSTADKPQIFTMEPLYLKVRGGVIWNIFTSHSKLLKIVLSTGFEDYEKGEVFRDVYQSLLGTGVFNSDGMHSDSSHSTASDTSPRRNVEVS